MEVGSRDLGMKLLKGSSKNKTEFMRSYEAWLLRPRAL